VCILQSILPWEFLSDDVCILRRCLSKNLLSQSSKSLKSSNQISPLNVYQNHYMCGSESLRILTNYFLVVSPLVSTTYIKSKSPYILTNHFLAVYPFPNYCWDCACIVMQPDSTIVPVSVQIIIVIG
jgi:hypothetical protein